jgi:hypothetical protein
VRIIREHGGAATMNLHATLPLDEVPIAAGDDTIARLLAEARLSDGAALLDALEARRGELQLSNATLEGLAGLPTGYLTKLTGPARLKNPTLSTVDRIMAVLGLSWILVIDSEKVSRAQPSWQRRDQAHVRTRQLSPTTIARARPAVMAELVRKASRPRWKGATARDFLQAMAEAGP